MLVLEALKNNDNPTPNKGVEILFGYSSSSSQIMNEEGLTPKEYADFLKETEYKVLFDHEEVVRTTIQTIFHHIGKLQLGLCQTKCFLFCLYKCYRYQKDWINLVD